MACIYITGAFLSGLCWSALILLYHPDLPLLVQLFLLVTLGMPTASLPSNGVFLPVFFAFALPILVVLMGWGLFLAPDLTWPFTIMALLYAALVSLAAIRYSASLRKNIVRNEENNALIREVQAVVLPQRSRRPGAG